jgi:Domain of unknown function (DUF4386)
LVDDLSDGRIRHVRWRQAYCIRRAAATAANILANEPSFRLGVAANLIATACYLTATLLVYDLLKPVNRNLFLLAAFFSITGCAIGAFSMLFQLAPWSSWEGRST